MCALKGLSAEWRMGWNHKSGGREVNQEAEVKMINNGGGTRVVAVEREREGSSQDIFWR